MGAMWLLPCIVFGALVAIEHATRPRHETVPFARADHALNLAGLAIQGAVVPLAGYGIAQSLAAQWPAGAGALHLGAIGAFTLNFVAVDFLYYWQHRLFHRVPALWALHQCHHASTTLSVWATSRNSLAINFLFVYMLLNPVLGFLCGRPDAFFFGAIVTACLDLWRHSRLPERFGGGLFGLVLVTPRHHHAHHGIDTPRVNFGANLIVWDRLFGTAYDPQGYPGAYGARGAPGPWRQFIHPW
jgi:sterol desaturase/sphingolipid hydroxylase (fatty acid hydroxylase superfamily)